VTEAKKNFEAWIEPMLRAVHRRGDQAPPGRRVYIPQPGKQEKRPLGVPIWHSYCTFIQRSLGLSLQAGDADTLSYRPHTLHFNTLQSSRRCTPATIASTGRPPQCGDDLRCQHDPARTHWHRPQAIQAPLLAPLADRRDMHVEHNSAAFCTE
jgi:hypothetical protein